MGANESVPYVHIVRYRGRSIVFLLSQRETAPLIFRLFQFRFSPVSCHVTKVIGHTCTLNYEHRRYNKYYIVCDMNSKSFTPNQPLCTKRPRPKSYVFRMWNCKTYMKWGLLKIPVNFFPFWPLSLIQITYFRRNVKCRLHTVIIKIFSNSPKSDKGKTDSQKQWG